GSPAARRSATRCPPSAPCTRSVPCLRSARTPSIGLLALAAPGTTTAASARPATEAMTRDGHLDHESVRLWRSPSSVACPRSPALRPGARVLYLNAMPAHSLSLSLCQGHGPPGRRFAHRAKPLTSTPEHC